MRERIVWLSRHPLMPAQLDELHALYPGCSVVEDGHTYDSVDAIQRRIQQSGGTILCVTGIPLSMLERLLLVTDLPVIRPVVERLADRPEPVDDERDFVYHRQWFRHRGYEQVLGLEWRVRPLHIRAPRPVEG